MNDKEFSKYLVRFSEMDACVRFAARRTDPEGRQRFKRLLKEREDLQERFREHGGAANGKDLTHEDYLAKRKGLDAAMRIIIRSDNPEWRQSYRPLSEEYEEVNRRYWRQTESRRVLKPWTAGAL